MIDEAEASLDRRKITASNITAELEASAPVHRRDLAFLDKLDRAQQCAAKICQQMLDSSSSMGSTSIAMLRELQEKLHGAQVNFQEYQEAKLSKEDPCMKKAFMYEPTRFLLAAALDAALVKHCNLVALVVPYA